MPAAAPWPVSQDLPGLAGRAHALSLSAGADLGDLADALLRIEPVACELELRPGGHEAPALLAWLVELKGAVADAEDLLDEVHIRRRGQAGPVALSICVGAAFPNPQARKLRGLVGRLDRVREGSDQLRGGLGRVAVECGVRSPNRVTGSFLVERRVIGRQKECDEVVNRLINDLGVEKCSSSAPVVALVGHGGMGKTTVAQCVYNDARIEAHFDLRAWVCVWDRSDEAELTREILQSIGSADETLRDDGMASLERLQERLEESVASKRFLLVLDDVWVDEGKTVQENRAAWSRVLAPLRFAGSGSKVLVTTRVKLVAEVLNATSVVPLDGLRSYDCWLLLKEATFVQEHIQVGKAANIEMPESISELVHLRYLALCCKTIKLPKCINKLRHLEVLDMPLFHDNYPGDISKFVTLKHLETCYRHKDSKCSQLVSSQLGGLSRPVFQD
ncbi:hypothetical protein QOZ80_5BG0420370 [Eleusine coracana subsp. coracana]|nr:hypothetical protein QOZ80_5BG0420370 [Eleusine coracana subsp. coracana]